MSFNPTETRKLKTSTLYILENSSSPLKDSLCKIKMRRVGRGPSLLKGRKQVITFVGRKWNISCDRTLDFGHLRLKFFRRPTLLLLPLNYASIVAVKTRIQQLSLQLPTKFGNIVRVETSRYLTKITTLRRKVDHEQL